MARRSGAISASEAASSSGVTKTTRCSHDEAPIASPSRSCPPARPAVHGPARRWRPQDRRRQPRRPRRKSITRERRPPTTACGCPQWTAGVVKSNGAGGTEHGAPGGRWCSIQGWRKRRFILNTTACFSATANGVQAQRRPPPPFDALTPRGAVGSTRHALLIGPERSFRTPSIRCFNRRRGVGLRADRSGRFLRDRSTHSGGHRFRGASGGFCSSRRSGPCPAAPRFTRMKVALKARRC